MSGFRKQCIAITKGGERCRGNALDDSEFCFSHSPELAERRREGCSQGGKAKANIIRLEKLMPSRLHPVYEEIEDVLFAVRKGKVDPKVVHAMAAAAKALVMLLQVAEFEERLASLEQKTQSIADDRPIRRFR